MVTIVFGDLSDLIKRSGQAAEELDDYQKRINNNIIKKLNSYSGSRTGNINDALTRLNKKRKDMCHKRDRYNDYADKVRKFKSNTESREKHLKNKINSIFCTYAKKWGLKTKKGFFERVIGGLITICTFGLINGDDVLYHVSSHVQHIKDNVKNWYHYEGGREIIQAVFDCVLAVLAVVAAVLAITFTGGAAAVFFGIVACLYAANKLLNAMAKIGAYADAMSEGHVLDKAAKNKIASSMDFATMLRRNGQYDAANAFKTYETVVNILNFVGSFNNFLGKLKVPGGKWVGWKEGFKNTLKDLFCGGTTKWASTVGKLKKLEKVVKAVENITTLTYAAYNMITTRTYGQTGWDAFMTKMKAGKDGIDLVVNTAIGNLVGREAIERKTSDVDPVDASMFEAAGHGDGAVLHNYQNWNDTRSKLTVYTNDGGKWTMRTYTNKTYSLASIFNKGYKTTFSSINAYHSVANHRNLNLSNFSYDKKIDKELDKNTGSKFFSNLTSPVKTIENIAGIIEKIHIPKITLPQINPVLLCGGYSW